MIRLNTIQKRNKLNEVWVVGTPGNGGAYHKYRVEYDGDGDGYITKHGITFQNGPRNDKASIHGILDVDLLEIVRHRLQCFQEGEYATRENALALTHVEEALLWLNKRTEDRAEKNILGTMEK